MFFAFIKEEKRRSMEPLDFIKEYWYMILLTVAIGVGQLAQKFNLLPWQKKEMPKDLDHDLVFAPLDGKGDRGPADSEYPYGPRIDRIGSRYILLTLGVLLFFGIFAVSLKFSDFGSTTEGKVSLAIIGSAGLYLAFQMTRRVDLYERGFVIRHLFGKRAYFYDEIEEIIFTSERVSKPSKIWFVWRVAVVIFQMKDGRTLEMSGLYHSRLKSKMTRLDQNLVQE